MPPRVLEKLNQRGIDPDNFALSQLWPEVLDETGVDISSMSAAEMEVMVTYGTLRRYLIEKYPMSEQEAKAQGQVWDEKLSDPRLLKIHFHTFRY